METISFQETAAVLGISERGLRSRIHRRSFLRPRRLGRRAFYSQVELDLFMQVAPNLSGETALREFVAEVEKARIQQSQQVRAALFGGGGHSFAFEGARDGAILEEPE